jgi:hypothetical protein
MAVDPDHEGRDTSHMEVRVMPLWAIILIIVLAVLVIGGGYGYGRR